MQVTVGRDSLSLPPFDLEVPGARSIVAGGLDSGEQGWRKETVTVPWCTRPVVLSSVREMSTGRIGVRCRGVDLSALKARIREVIEAFDQPQAFTVSWVIDGAVWQGWLVEQHPKVLVGDAQGWSADHLRGLQQVVTFTCSYSSLQTGGAL